MAGIRTWQVLVWVAWAGIAASLVLGWYNFDWYDFEWWPGLGTSILTLAASTLLLLVARRHDLGWIVDESGERQKVTYRLRGKSFFEPTTRELRLAQEAVGRGQRRKRILWSAVVGAPAGYALWQLWQTQSAFLIFIGVPLLLVVLTTATILLFNLALECLYLLGYQDMTGARVLDPPPRPPGLDTVRTQKTFGGARLATESEAINLLNPK